MPGRTIVPAVIGLAALLPLLGTDLVVFKSGLLLVALVAVLGLHILVNWAGELSLAHAGAVGLSAFAVLAVSEVWGISPVYLLPFGLVVGTCTGGVIGLTAMRAGGLQVALVTLVAGFAIDRFFLKQLWLVGRVARQASKPELGPFDLTSRRSMYILLLILSAASLVAVSRLHGSKLGRGWFWVRQNQAGAAAFGVPVARYRMLAYAVSGAFAGVAGGMYAGWVRTFSGQVFPLQLSFFYLLLAVIAGPGVIWGVVAAVLLLQGGQTFAVDLVGRDLGGAFETAIAYIGPIALLVVITRYQGGLTGIGHVILARLRSVTGGRDGVMGDPPEFRADTGANALVGEPSDVR